MPLDYFAKIHSTNEYVKENLKKYSHNFSGVYSFHQTNGKGVAGNIWVSEPEKNIALTFCLTDTSILNHNLSFWIAIVVCEFIQKITNFKTFIKWPNDILIHKKKVCGILIEKSGNTFIIGIGVNVLQEKFPTVAKASSLISFSPQKYILPCLVNDLINDFKENYKFLSDTTCLQKKYNRYLFGKGNVMTFKINNLTRNGIIRKVENDGLLQVEFDSLGILKFRIKEIEFLY